MDALHKEGSYFGGWSSANAVRNIWVGDGIADEFLVSSDDGKNFSQPLTLVEKSALDSRRLQSFYSVGEIRCLPKDFVFSHMTLCTLITSWFCGNLSLKTLPFKFLKQCNLKDENTKRVFQKMRAMINAVIVRAKKRMHRMCNMALGKYQWHCNV
jgi:hypothetical protein